MIQLGVSLYPEQETGAAIPDILSGDTPQASKTWKMISWLKQKVLAFQQTTPKDQKA